MFFFFFWGGGGCLGGEIIAELTTFVQSRYLTLQSIFIIVVIVIIIIIIIITVSSVFCWSQHMLTVTRFSNPLPHFYLSSPPQDMAQPHPPRSTLFCSPSLLLLVLINDEIFYRRDDMRQNYFLVTMLFSLFIRKL